MLTAEKLKRYKDIALFLMKHSKKDLIRTGTPEEILLEEDRKETKEEKSEAIKFADDLEELGPTFIKLGQLLSTRPDFLPPDYITALTRLQDKVDPFPLDKVENIIQEELGVRMSKAFLEFEDKPLAAASLGQVHRAVLRNGKVVAVKVQRPEIRQVIFNDLEAITDIVSTIDEYTEIGRKFALEDILNEFKKALVRELDYLQEAQNLIKLGEILTEYDTIVIPQPVMDYSTSKVLVMDYVQGRKLTSLNPVVHTEINGEHLAEQLFKAYLDQILVHGFFHADPHPGNVFLTDDHRISLIDLGMVARLDPRLRERLLKMLIHISEGNGRDAAKISLDMSITTEESNTEKFIKEVSDFVGQTLGMTINQLNMGRIVLDLTRLAGQNNIRTTPELTMIGKALLNLDEIGKTLAPDFDPNASIRKHTESIIRKQIFRDLSSGNIFSSVLELKEFVQRLPGRLNEIMDGLIGNKFVFRVQAFDDLSLMENLQKIANRITMGLILAALIIGAALLIRAGGDTTILGYPALAIILFLMAAGGGMALVFNILISDRRQNKKYKRKHQQENGHK
jgi:ubiquinone biosynthesis protein